MSQTILITITAPNSNVGPFNLYSCTGSTCSVTPFEYNLSRATLIAGYTSTLVPNGATSIRIKSTGFCDNYIDVVISGTSPTPPPTQTPTTTPTQTPTPTPTTTPTPTPTPTRPTFKYYNAIQYSCGSCDIINPDVVVSVQNPSVLVIGSYYYFSSGNMSFYITSGPIIATPALQPLLDANTQSNSCNDACTGNYIIIP